MTHLFANHFDASNGFFLPTRRISNGLTLADLSVFGVEVVGEPDELGYQRCMLPGWKPVPADESPMQLRLHDAQDRLRAKIFYKPGSQGAGASMQLWTRYNVELRTDDVHQWAEVTDGNEVLFTGEKALRSERNLDAFGFNSSKQPEYIAAAEWLEQRCPAHADPLAYWN